ncbi:nucleotidyltransferase [Galdieria sulphuraria]|uniref:Nucleotidyltransferase n=1 Tax=Galdieria sulphuraria TaxID=130081 RepID=M2XPV9_GALSU|nr:nucleotidyltransferase [Galdieria sulphuraria]EME32252.1 nucleotidyltransferase [Galdieria sulphuraria]|eukprot:XP_005708772.1 nucleotidyltransferase [Galdieria sulphuraria]
MTLLRGPTTFACWNCSLWIRRYYRSFDPNRLSTCGQDTYSQERQIAPQSTPLTVYLQCVAWRPELFSFKNLGTLLEKHSHEVFSIPVDVFEAIENKFSEIRQALKKSHNFLGRVEYYTFFTSILSFIRDDILEISRNERNSKELLDLILKYRREQDQLLDLPKFFRTRASGGNSLWHCSLLLSGYNFEAYDCKNLKTGKREVFAKAVFQIFADFVKNVENDFYFARNEHDDCSLDSSLRSLIAKRQPTKDDFNSIALLKRRLQKVIQKQYPDCSLEIFGSAVTGLWKPASDVDFVVLPKNTMKDKKSKPVKYLRVLAGVLRSTEMFSVFLIGNAKVPIVKFVDHTSGLKGDISWDSSLGLVNSKLIRQYLDMDELVKDFVWLVKEWVSARRIAGAPQHYPSSYCWVLMCLWFLQRVKKVLPVISVPEEMSKRKQVDWILEYTYRKDGKSISSEYTLTQLLEQFFRHFAYEISIDAVIFVSQTSLLMKHSGKNSKWRVEDPLEFERDLMCHVSHTQFQVILYEFLRAHRIISTENNISKLFDIPKGENIRRRMIGYFDCLLETELNGQAPLKGYK